VRISAGELGKPERQTWRSLHNPTSVVALGVESGIRGAPLALLRNGRPEVNIGSGSALERRVGDKGSGKRCVCPPRVPVWLIPYPARLDSNTSGGAPFLPCSVTVHGWRIGYGRHIQRDSEDRGVEHQVLALSTLTPSPGRKRHWRSPMLEASSKSRTGHGRISGHTDTGCSGQPTAYTYSARTATAGTMGVACLSVN